jgi:Na+/H+-translocating membrane pyrophosphatase
MKADVYTKIVLTVIALALVANFFKGTDIITTAQAHPSTLPAPTIMQQTQTIDVNIVSVNGKPLLERMVDTKTGKAALLPFSIENANTTVDVNLSQFAGVKLNTYHSYYRKMYYIPVSNNYDNIDNSYKSNWLFEKK